MIQRRYDRIYEFLMSGSRFVIDKLLYSYLALRIHANINERAFGQRERRIISRRASSREIVLTLAWRNLHKSIVQQSNSAEEDSRALANRELDKI